MSEHENRQLVEQAYANFKAGDIPTLLQSMSEDITWQLPEVENVPFFRQATGARRGRRVLLDARQSTGCAFIRGA